LPVACGPANSTRSSPTCTNGSRPARENGTALHAEIVEQGYTGSYNTLERYLKPLRRSEAATLAQVLRNRPPAVRQVTGWITGLPGNLDPADEARLKAIRARCPEIDAAVWHAAGFARMIKDLSGDKNTLTEWMVAVDHDLPAFARSPAGSAVTSMPSPPG